MLITFGVGRISDWSFTGIIQTKNNGYHKDPCNNDILVEYWTGERLCHLSWDRSDTLCRSLSIYDETVSALFQYLLLDHYIIVWQTIFRSKYYYESSTLHIHSTGLYQYSLNAKLFAIDFLGYLNSKKDVISSTTFQILMHDKLWSAVESKTIDFINK